MSKTSTQKSATRKQPTRNKSPLKPAATKPEEEDMFYFNTPMDNDDKLLEELLSDPDLLPHTNNPPEDEVTEAKPESVINKLLTKRRKKLETEIQSEGQVQSEAQAQVQPEGQAQVQPEIIPTWNILPHMLIQPSLIYAKPIEGMNFVNNQVKKPVHIFNVNGITLPLEGHHPLELGLAAFPMTNPDYDTIKEMYMNNKLTTFLTNKIVPSVFMEVQSESETHTIYTYQFRAPHSLSPQTPPAFFAQNESPLIDLSPGMHCYAYMDNAMSFSSMKKRFTSKFAPPSFLFVQNLKVDDFIKQSTIPQSDIEKLVRMIDPLLNYEDMTQSELVKFMKENNLDSMSKEAARFVEEIVGRTAGPTVLRYFKNGSAVSKVRSFFDQHYKTLWKTPEEFEKNKDNYSIFVVDVFPDIASQLKKCEVFKNIPSDQLLAYVMQNAVMGIFVGFLNNETKQFDLSTFFQLRHVHPEALVKTLDENETDLIMHHFDSEKRTSLQFDQVSGSSFFSMNQAKKGFEAAKFLSRCAYDQEKLKSAFDEALEVRNNNIDYREFWALTEVCVMNQVIETAQPVFKGKTNFIPYTAKFFQKDRTIGHKLRSQNTIDFTRFCQQATLFNFDPSVKAVFMQVLESGNLDQLHQINYQPDGKDFSMETYSDKLKTFGQPIQQQANFYCFFNEVQFLLNKHIKK